MNAIRFVVLAALLAGFVSPAHAAEQTLEGTLVCAKCYLKKADAHECQDVLLVPTASGAKAEYYVRKNEVAKESGEVCTTQVKARVTGTVSAKDMDGKIWVTPSKIEKLPSSAGA
jgi:uncharacterized protein DUF6370